MREELLPASKIARQLGFSETWGYALKRAMIADGVAWPGGRQTLRAVEEWPPVKAGTFRVRDIYACRADRRKKPQG